MDLFRCPNDLKKLTKAFCRFIFCMPSTGAMDSHPVNFSNLDSSPEAIAKDVEYALQVGFGMLGWLQHLQPLSGKTVLEIGPGINFGPILVLACYGATPIVVDRFLAPWDPQYHPRFYRAFRTELLTRHPQVDPHPIDRLLESSNYVEGLPHRLIGGAESLNLPSSSVDIVLSNAALEHLEDHSKAFLEFFRITKVGGWGFHQVDFRDHRSFELPLEHLLLSSEEFERVANACYQVCGTDLRHFEMIHLLISFGFDLKTFTPRLFRRARIPRPVNGTIKKVSQILLS